MPRVREGTAYKHKDHYDIRITLPDGTRSKPMCMPKGMSKEKAKEKARVLTELAAKEALPKTDAPPTPAVVAPLVPSMASGPNAALTAAGTPVPDELFIAYVPRWIQDRKDRGLSSVSTDRGRLINYVAPRLPGKTMQRVTTDDLEGLVEYLDEVVQAGQIEWLTARNIWRTLAKLFVDATQSKKRALRVCRVNPALGIKGPDSGVEKSKQYLYPTEFLMLVSCEAVPLCWRRIYALSVYLCVRAGELEALKLDAIDRARGNVHVHQGIDRERDTVKSTKTKQARRFSVEVAILPLLRAVYDEALAAGSTTLIATMPPIEDLSATFREHLALAGITRAELFINDKTRKNIRFHDLRATGLTWMAVRGDDPLKIKFRAGHACFSTTEGYIRDAEQVREGFGTVFPLLPVSLLGEAAAARLAELTARPVPESTEASVPEPSEPPSEIFPGGGPSVFAELPAELLALLPPRESSDESSEAEASPLLGGVNPAILPGFGAPPARVERTTFGLGNRCSIH